MGDAAGSTAPGPGAARSGTQRLAQAVLGRRRAVALAIAAATLFFAYPIVHAGVRALGIELPGPRLRIDTSVRDLFPDHPYVHTQDAFAETFGGSALVAIALSVEEGTIFRPELIRALREITRELDGAGYPRRDAERDALRARLESRGLAPERTREALDRAFPPYPVDHDRVRSLTHPTTRVFRVAPDGAVRQDVLVQRLPETQAEADALREQVRRSAPQAFGRLVSRDERSALVSAGFVADRLDRREAVRAVFEHVRGIERRWEAELPGVRLSLAGEPIERGWILSVAPQVAGLVLASLGLVLALLWLTFRSVHGVVLPALAAGTTGIWGLGFAGWLGIPFDPLILVIPLLITARAVSHAVQMTERFQEDYAAARLRLGDAQRARDAAARSAFAALVVPGTLGVLTDVAGLLVILLTTIPQMRHLAVFGAFWVAAIVVTVEILQPVLICSLPPPRARARAGARWLARVADALARAATHPRGSRAIAAAALALGVGCTAIALARATIGDASAGTPLLWPGHPYNRASAEIGERFGGVDSLVVYLDGDRPQAAADATPLLAMQRFARAQAEATPLGASLSLVPLLRELWRRNHYGDPKWSYLPADSGTVRSMIFQLRQDGPPGFLRPYLSDDGRQAMLAFYYDDRRSQTIDAAVGAAERFIAANPLGEVSIRLERDRAPPDAPWHARARWLDRAHYLFGPLLPPRHHTLRVRIRGEDGAYADAAVASAARDGLPVWIDEFREAALARHAERSARAAALAVPPPPAALAGWSRDDVGSWWESEAFGARAVVVGTRHLLVHDRRARGSAPEPQPTGAWTRGAWFALAGGSLGVRAAINQEVERSHVANLSLILLAIFVLHSLTYRSATSGAIVLLQLATATAISLAFMALRGVGLNVHTLPVQAVGVGIGVDYAIYIVDRIRQEAALGPDLDEAIRRAVRTTGRAVALTASTIVGGIALWVLSPLRFQAEMAGLLALLMLLNMLGALSVVPACYSILAPRTLAPRAD